METQYSNKQRRPIQNQRRQYIQRYASTTVTPTKNMQQKQYAKMPEKHVQNYSANKTGRSLAVKIAGGLAWGLVSGIILDMLLILLYPDHMRKDIYLLNMVLWMVLGLWISSGKRTLRSVRRGLVFSILLTVPLCIYMYLTDAYFGFFILEIVWSTLWAALIGLIWS